MGTLAQIAYHRDSTRTTAARLVKAKRDYPAYLHK
jgi:hypothetical protein